MFLCAIHWQVDPPTKVYVADMPIKQLTGADEYFERLGWGELPQVCRESKLKTKKIQECYQSLYSPKVCRLMSRQPPTLMIGTAESKSPMASMHCHFSSCRLPIFSSFLCGLGLLLLLIGIVLTSRFSTCICAFFVGTSFECGTGSGAFGRTELTLSPLTVCLIQHGLDRSLCLWQIPPRLAGASS